MNFNMKTINSQIFYDDYIGTSSYLLSDFVYSQYLNSNSAQVVHNDIILAEIAHFEAYRSNIFEELANDAKFGIFNDLYKIEVINGHEIKVTPNMIDKFKLFLGDGEYKSEFITRFYGDEQIHHRFIEQQQLIKLSDLVGEERAKHILNLPANLIGMSQIAHLQSPEFGHNGAWKNIRYSNINEGYEEIKDKILAKQQHADYIFDAISGSFSYSISYAIMDIFAESGEDISKIDKSISVGIHGLKGIAIFNISESIEYELKDITSNSTFFSEIFDDSIANIFIAKGIIDGVSGILRGDMEYAKNGIIRNAKSAVIRCGMNSVMQLVLNALGWTSLDPTYITTGILLTINIGKFANNKITANKLENHIREYYYKKAECSLNAIN